MKYTLVGPNLYMDDVGTLYKREGDVYVPVKNKVTDAENRYVQNKLKGVTRHEKK